MKNSFLIFYTWLFFFFLSYFLRFQNLGAWTLLLFVSYVFYTTSVWQSLFIASLSILTLSAWTEVAKECSLFLLMLYGVMFIFRHKALRPSLYLKAFWPFLSVSLFFLYIHRTSLEMTKGYFEWALYSFRLVVYFVWSLFIWYLLEEGGSRFEDSFFSSQDQKQLNLFTVRQLRQIDSSSPFKFQKRIRRRFGLKDW